MTATGPRTTPDVMETVDVVALGESMTTFLPSRPGRLADVPSFERTIGGAESNTACVLAAAGHPTRWISAVGQDGFGDHLVQAIGEYGVDVSYVRRDPHRPTGVYFRTAGDRATAAHEVAYYRAGSAASAMTSDNTDLEAVLAGRVLHLSGITAALSPGCLELMRELTAPRPERPIVSFDVNHRPGLWRDTHAPGILLELARGADIVFVGEDEAETAWGIKAGPSSIREVLPEPDVLVVKQGSRGATVFCRTPVGSGAAGEPGVPPLEQNREQGGKGSAVASTGEATPSAPDAAARPWSASGTFVPALTVDVVAPTGAGDAFAAGFLSATLRALPLRDRLRHGHLTAAAALTVPGDFAAPPARSLADRLAALDDAEWGGLRLGPGWTERGTTATGTAKDAGAGADRAEDEVPTS